MKSIDDFLQCADLFDDNTEIMSLAIMRLTNCKKRPCWVRACVDNFSHKSLHKFCIEILDKDYRIIKDFYNRNKGLFDDGW